MTNDLPSIGAENAPKTYECTVIFDASNSVTVEAFSPEEAAYMAMDLCDGNQRLCHQCERALNTGDPIGVHVYQDGEQVADTSWSGEQVARLTAERDALAVRVRELEWLDVRWGRVTKAAEHAHGPDAIRFKFSLRKNGTAMNNFPKWLDGRWVSFVFAEDDAHIGYIAKALDAALTTPESKP